MEVRLVFNQIKMYLLGVVAFVVTIFGIYFKGKSAGKQAAANERKSRRIDAMKTAKDVRDDVESDPYFIDRVSKWVRTNDKR